ncbi:hypothetical protein [Lamprocystis purpurea]|jgi:hypothetical protein|uniref:hypothetical protein n=1 Tax=Lamprocystis purpurea TaxID=61598 RepID=UPI0012F910C0|nr:hypothetical protein [Lamprocystis purpurea]MBV5347801.1 hypothetical protein [bacterium]
MWNDSIVEETRRLRDEYSAKLNYSVHAIAEDLKQWERQGFPMAADPDKAVFIPGVSGGLHLNASEPRNKDSLTSGLKSEARHERFRRSESSE